MRILITGMGGFVGTNLAKRLSTECDVIGIDKEPKYYPLNNSMMFQQNLNDLKYYNSYLDGFDTIYHLAASADIKRSMTDCFYDLENNIRATINVLELMRKKDIPEIVFTSSSAVYGVQDFRVDETSNFKPINYYGASKVAAEAYINTYADLYGFETTILRPAQIIGDYEHRGVIVDFYHKLKKDPTKLEILGNGKQTKSYLHISDIVDALVTLRGGIYNLGNLTEISVNKLAEIVNDELNLNPMITYTGGDRGWPGDTPYYKLSIDKALSSGWKPKYDCEESIRKTIRWLDDIYSNSDKKRL